MSVALSQITPLWINNPLQTLPQSDLDAITLEPLSTFRDLDAQTLRELQLLKTITEIEQSKQVLRTESFTVEEVLETRNAIKFSSKLFADRAFCWGEDRDLPFTAHLIEVSTLLNFVNSSPELVQASLLYPALSSPLLETPRVLSAIQKKFSPDVLFFVSEVGGLFARPHTEKESLEQLNSLIEQNPSKAQAIATLHCAIYTTRLANGIESVIKGDSLRQAYIYYGVPALLINQFGIETTNCSSCSKILPIPTHEKEATNYTLEEAIDIRNSLSAAAVVYKNSFRKWGPYEQIPLISHAGEVATLLMLSRQSRDVVVSGFLHDFLEGYVNNSKIDLSEIVERFGKNVFNLVSKVTEPERNGLKTTSESLEEWLRRKTAIVERLHSGNNEFAELVAATKISTIAAGNKMLYLGEKLERWSNGPTHANIDIFIQIRDAYGKKGRSEILGEQLDLEIERLILQASKARYTNNACDD